MFDLVHIDGDVTLALQAGGGHVVDVAKDGPLSPGKSRTGYPVHWRRTGHGPDCGKKIKAERYSDKKRHTSCKAVRLSEKTLLSYRLFIRPVDAFSRTCIDCLLNTIFIASFRHNNYCFFNIIIKFKHFRAKFYTAFATNAFFCFNIHGFFHDIPFLAVCGLVLLIVVSFRKGRYV